MNHQRRPDRSGKKEASSQPTVAKKTEKKTPQKAQSKNVKNMKKDK